MSSYNIEYLIKKRLVLSLSKGFATAFAVAILFLNSQAQAADIDPSVLDTTSSSGPGTVISGNNFTAEGVPVILPRSTWENTDELRAMMTWFPEESHIPPDYASVERIVVHDLGCRLSSPACNSDSTNPISLIQAVYRFHAITYGWEDIGYNYIIDRQGRIYEGRFGGNGTRGAHLYHSRKCQNFNINTVGIMLLGNYAATPMPQAMEDSLARLSAWLAVVNGFEPSAVSTSEIWENPRNIEGKCDISSGAYSTTFTGPTVLSHGDIEAGNSDFFDFTLLRTKAQNFAATYKNLFYKTINNSDIFSLSGGAVRKAVSANTDKIVAISETQLHLFPSETLTKFVDGTLIRSASRGRIYKVEAGKRRDILNEEIFKLANFKWEDIKIVSDRELILYPFGEPVPYPDGTLVKDEAGTVYKFEGGKLRHITSAALFSVYKLNWSAVKNMASKDLNLYSKGQPLVYPDGTLITSDKIIKGVSNTIYKVESGQRRPISSQTLFIKLKLSTKNIKKISDTEMSFYPVGQYVNWPGGTLLRSSNDTKVWYIQSGFKRWIQDGSVLKALGFSWNSINIVSTDEMNSYQEAQPIIVKTDIKISPVAVINYSNLIKTNGTIYNLITGIAYSNPETLAKDLGIQSSQIDWSKITIDQVSTIPAPPQTSPPTGGSSTTPPPPVPPTAPVLAEEPKIRIGIYSPAQGETVQVTSSSVYTITKTNSVNEDKLAGIITNIIPDTTTTTRIIPKDSNGIITLNSYTNLAYNGTNDNTFRGIIEIVYSATSQKYWVVNELPIESYLKGIAEMANGELPEYAKAFMISARSYAYYYIKEGGKRAGEPYHLINTPSDQWYKGYNFELRAKDTVTGVTATHAQVATYDNKPIVAAYSSGAPGLTKNACEVWGGKYCTADYIYLNGGVDDPSGTIYKNQSCSAANHCVGLDADGARRMTALGSKAEDILKKYYPGIVLTQAYK